MPISIGVLNNCYHPTTVVVKLFCHGKWGEDVADFLTSTI